MPPDVTCVASIHLTAQQTHKQSSEVSATVVKLQAGIVVMSLCCDYQ